MARNQSRSEPDLSQLSFEEALRRLEEVVEDLEGGELSLAAALERFEEGMRLRAECLKRLREAEAKVEQVLADSASSEEETGGFSSLPGDEE